MAAANLNALKGQNVLVRFTDPSTSDGVGDLRGELVDPHDGNGYLNLVHDGKLWAIPRAKVQLVAEQ